VAILADEVLYVLCDVVCDGIVIWCGMGCRVVGWDVIWLDGMSWDGMGCAVQCRIMLWRLSSSTSR
jgi:hypothetical protein